MSRGRDRALTPTLALLLLAAGCTTPSYALPSWAVHVRPAEVDPASSTADVAKTLLAELREPDNVLADGHLAPEQIATVALRELVDGRQVDAALWLSMASYRYHQEVIEGMRQAVASYALLSRKMSQSAAYRAHIEHELDRYTHLDFAHELTAIRSRLYGRDQVEKALHEQLVALGETTPMEQESLRDALWQMRPGAAGIEAPSQIELAEAFHRRLLGDFARDPKDEHPAVYLARTPVAAMQVDALSTSVGFFMPPVCTALADGFPALRPSVVAQLGARRAEVRANAAATLALAPAPATRALLEQRLPAEPDARVKLVIEYALVYHGAAEHVAALNAALQSCQGAACTLPAMLAEWLPWSAKGELDAAGLARIAAGGQFEPRAHTFAVATLHQLARDKPLPLPIVEALIVAGRRGAVDDEALAANQAFATLENAVVLSRADVVARIKGSDRASPASQMDVLHPAPLLARLAKLSIVDDLPLLDSLMDRFGEAKGPEAHLIVDAAVNIPGPEADARLAAWYERHPALRLHIGIALAGRDTFPRARLDGMIVTGGARARIAVKALRHDRDAQATLRGYLREGNIQAKFAAAELAGLFGEAGAREDLRALLNYHNYYAYPDDVLVRHAAASSLLRLALAASKPAPAAAAPAEPSAAPTSP